MDFFITGYAGLIGSHLTEKPLNKDNVRAPLGNTSTHSGYNAFHLSACGGYEPYLASLRDQSLIIERIEE